MVHRDAGNQIAKIAAAGVVSELAIPTINSGAVGITSGPDGNIWFTETEAGNVGKLTPSSAGIFVDGYMSGNWYDPEQSGQGFQIEIAAGNTMVAIWFTYAPDGSGQNWIYAQGNYDSTKNTVILPAVLASGAMFPPNFHANDVTKQPWIRLRLRLATAIGARSAGVHYCPVMAVAFGRSAGLRRSRARSVRKTC